MSPLSPAVSTNQIPAGPAFLITIDTEGDNLWSRPREITTENSRFLPRFQTLCEKYGLRPTWLTNWEMADCPVFCEFAHDVLDRGTGEVGMHLHAWNNPPLLPRTSDDFQTLPYLTHYSESLMRQKVRAITDQLEETFGVKMLSHRAGRWGFNETYARILVEHGYQVDCSVSPHIRWTHDSLPGELDYRGFPDREYFLNLDQISQPSPGSPLLELPMTVLLKRYSPMSNAARSLLARHSLGRRVASRLLPDVEWLRPDGRTPLGSVATLKRALADGRPYVEFMLHSSEFMPGGSPRFPTERHIDQLYDELEQLFETAAQTCEGLTLSQYRDRVVARTRREAALQLDPAASTPELATHRRAG
jgi:peptidoglycan/xylan/chitin deacetylase (PgdA/CDA1 family)